MGLLLALLALGTAACGRAGLDDYLGDGGLPDVLEGSIPDGPAVCSASTCPAGCCDANGKCQAGTQVTQCGSGGQVCENCPTHGFQVCDATHQACSNPVPECNGETCSGCCIGSSCFAGTDPNECGVGGSTCQACQSEGLACTGGQCTAPPACGPGTCSGCCFGGQCTSGTQQTACGLNGQQCQNCAGEGESCVVSGAGGTCETQAGCGPGNCPGCCSGNVCLSGNSATSCGISGNACANCEPIGETCNGGGQCVESQSCGPENCSFGCCLGNVCTPGSLTNACGFGGQACVNCQQFGETCAGQQCTATPPCGPGTCSGCCDFQGICEPGTFNTECGFGGQACEICTTVGETCQGQTCVPGQGCNPSNCPGCCDSTGVCNPGVSPIACGFGGEICADCAQFGEMCQNQQCFSACNPENCGGCCDGNGICQPGDDSNDCGFGGTTCESCVSFGETCQNFQCLSACNPQNCQGCCDGNSVCQPGFLDSQCGGFGSTCSDCATLNPPSTCDTSLDPPACASQQMSCPAPYPGCFPGTTTFAPTPEPVCSTNDLANAAAACAGGAATTACQNFFNFEFEQNPSCGGCLETFDVDFVYQTGIYACIAPYVTPACNGETGCSANCAEESCGSCPDTASYDQCSMTVGSGQCATYSQSAQQCEQQAFSGPAAFCNPGQYSGFGAWLQGVGAQFCGGVAVDAGTGE
jgi:hypothetical protein